MSIGEEIDEPQEDPEHRRLRELQEAEDAETFGMAGIARTGDVSIEESKATNRKLIWTCVIVGVISISLVACIAGAVVSYIAATQKTPEEEKLAKKKELGPVKEMRARIKEIDRNKNTMLLLVPPAIKRTYEVTPETDFLNSIDMRLPDGFNAREVSEGQDIVIMTTEDGKALRWVKLTK